MSGWDTLLRAGGFLGVAAGHPQRREESRRDFYTAVVGWSATQGEGPEGEYTMWVAGETPVGGLSKIREEAAAAGCTPGWFAYTAVPDVDATVAEARSLGATTLFPPTTLEGVGRLSVLRDLQGPVFAVIRGETASPIPDERTPEPPWT